ncbi:META domain-containing protein [Helicobacter aurati]|uniref:META domain-containing protein n=1 Tax=Helicobacter aurati TaxID=137778 RepID=A0A3D8J1M8_9HELI|nr:META domain-containing protein [Helicobacter aurati]RDU71273.1 META domain-containing protein [Helicobacter aurati]
MQNQTSISFIITSIVVNIMIAGCFFFATKSVFDKSNYEIVKLEVDNHVLLSPQELANQAKNQLFHGNKQNTLLDNNFLLNPHGKAMQNNQNDINTAFEQLKLRNNQDESLEDIAATPLNELAKITLKSTFNLDKTQDILYGKIGCNNYTAKFFWQDSTKIVVSGGASTRKLCYPKEVSDFQNAFVRNLDGIYTITKLRNRKGYVLNNGHIRIYLR